MPNPETASALPVDPAIITAYHAHIYYDPAATRDVVTRGALLSFDDEHWRRRGLRPFAAVNSRAVQVPVVEFMRR